MDFGLRNYINMYKKRGIRYPISYFFQTQLFDLINGTDTHIWLPKEEYTDQPENFENGTMYMSSWTKTIRQATLKAINIFSLEHEDIALIDLGCGKGKVLCVWSKMFPKIQKIMGVDYSPHLIEICTENLHKISANNVQVICDNVAEVNLPYNDNINIFYLYNPFDEEILVKFLNKFKSTNSIIIYTNPVHIDIFYKKGFKKIFEKKSWHPNAAYVLLANMIEKK
jgi:precorrin-6B methylase 2